MLDAFIIIFLIIGTGLIIYALIGMKESDPSGNESELIMENMIRVIDKSITDADNTVEELTKFSESLLTEIGEKYQELLYLYTLIDEKSQGLINSSVNIIVDEKNKESKPNKPKQTKVVPAAKLTPKKADMNLASPKYKEIFELFNGGLDIADIAKKLDIGQGEVRLILELGKDR